MNCCGRHEDYAISLIYPEISKCLEASFIALMAFSTSHNTAIVFLKIEREQRQLKDQTWN